MACSIEGCRRGGRTVRGWCDAHYQRWRKYGDPLGGGSDRAVRGTVEPWLRAMLVAPGPGCRLDWPFAVSNGYPKMHWRGAGRSVGYVVCELTYGPPPSPAHVARHGPCRNPMCIHPHHLSWGTPTENEADKLRDGTVLRGSRNHAAVLDRSEVLAIVDAVADGATHASLGERYGVSKSMIGAIARGERWSWLTGISPGTVNVC